MIKDKYFVLRETIQQPPSINSTQSYAFLFVNSCSGSCIGNSLISSKIKEIKVSPKPNLNTTFSIYDLYNQKQRLLAFKELHQKSKTADKIYIIICGGDGTVEWVIEESLKAQVDFQMVIFSVLPIGTGNDFAKSIGWGNFNFNVKHEKFQKLALQLQKAKVGYYDIWESTIECFNSGFITQIKNGQQYERSEKTLIKNFTNYFGIGTDAQIAYIAQRLKAKTAALKRIAYGIAGFLSFWMFCGNLRKLISQIQLIKKQQIPTEQYQLTQQEIKSKKSKKDLMQKIKISNNDCCMTFLNSTSSMDLERIWQTPYQANSQLKKQDFKQQNVNDGLIQIVSYRNQISLWFERAFHMAKKVGQGNGPYIINFREPKQGQIHNIYIHINGQPYRIANTRSITVSQSSKFPNGKIKVLYRQK